MKNILVLTYWSFNDALIQTYTVPYLKMMQSKLPKGSKIFLLCIEQKGYKGDVHQTRQKLEDLQHRGIIVIRKPYVPFGASAMFKWIPILMSLSSLIIGQRIKYIHSWCTPPGVFALLLSKIWRKPLILDSYEPHAEAMVENGSWHEGSKAFKILFKFEKKMTKSAKYIIGTTEGMRDYAWDKYQVKVKNFFVKPACVNVEQFDYAKPKSEKLIQDLGLEGKKVMLYAGKFGGIYFDKEVFEHIKVASEYYGKDQFRALILSNVKEDELQVFCDQEGLDRNLIVLRFVGHHEIQDYMNLADFAISPVRPIPTKRYCTPIKDGEYWAMGLPVIIPQNISDDSDIIEQHDIGYVLKDMTEGEYKKSLQKMDELMAQSDIKEKIRKVAFQYRDFKVADKVYQEIYG